MKRFIINIIMIFICFLLQSTVFGWFELAYVVPNLLIIVTVSLAFMRGKMTGMFVGLVCGLLVDMMYGNFIGVYGLIYMYIGYLNGFANKLFYIEEIILPLGLITISDLVYNFLAYVFTYLLHNRLDLPYYFKRIMLPEMIYTLLIAVFLYKLFYIINKRLDDSEKEEMNNFD